MEKYQEIKNDVQFTKKYGQYFDMVKKNHENKYQKKGFEIIYENTNKIYDKIATMRNTKNLLLVGKVQSGKTSNLELLTAMLFDNGYSVGVIFGGITEDLNTQIADRFKKTFDSRERNLLIVDTVSESIEGLRSILNQIGDERKLLVICLKNHQTIKNLANVLKHKDFINEQTFVIDDEGDQASLNTEFKKNKSSSTYASIIEILNSLNNPIYLSSTATPNAIVFQPQTSRINPIDVSLIQPGIGYYGADFFHSNDDKIILVEEDEDESILGKDLRHSINHFLLSSAILYEKHGIKNTSMIVHTNRLTVVHDVTLNNINDYKNVLENSQFSILEYEFKKTFNEKYFSKEIIDDFKLKNLIEIIKSEILPNTYLILYNGKGKETQQYMEYKRYVISVGGDLIQRGVTFDNLVTSYFTRQAKSGGNMDTTLQRARWFGYRNKIKDVVRVFTSEELKEDFSKLTDIEEELWSQFYDVEAGVSTLNEIYIDATDTEMSPSRRNVIHIEATNFKRKWHRQRLGYFDKNQVNNINHSVEKYLKTLSFKNVSLARSDTLENVKITSVTIRDFLENLANNLVLFKNPGLQNVFSLTEEKQNQLMDIILMDAISNVPRERTFDKKNKVNNLHQGQDKSNSELAKFFGDAQVINDRNRLTVQVFNVLPKINKVTREEFKQYMFAIHYPKDGVFYRRKS